MADVLVVIEYRKQIIADVSLEMLTKARQLADQSGGDVLAIIIGKEIDEHAATVASWANKVLVVKEGQLEQALAEPYQEILTPMIKERKPTLVLLGHSCFGADLAPALSIEVEAPLATNCIDISLENGNVRVTKSIYGDKVSAQYSFAPAETIIVTGRPGEFPIEKTQARGSVEEIIYPMKEVIGHKRFEGYLEPKIGEVDITKWDVLVAVGRGIKDKENIAMAEELARLLGGNIACSRPVVDSGWLPSDYQVGLSGKIVKPKLYLAIGISGAFQHLIGMKGSKMVVAINKDPEAPIFGVAHYCIVGDLFNVIPPLIQKIGELRG